MGLDFWCLWRFLLPPNAWLLAAQELWELLNRSLGPSPGSTWVHLGPQAFSNFKCYCVVRFFLRGGLLVEADAMVNMPLGYDMLVQFSPARWLIYWWLLRLFWDYRYVFRVLQGLVPNQLLHLGPRRYWSPLRTVRWLCPKAHRRVRAKLALLQGRKRCQSSLAGFKAPTISVKLPQMGPRHFPHQDLWGCRHMNIPIYTYSFAIVGNWFR